MLKTLHLYIWRDLVKVTGLALVAFTLVMTVFSIVEPMRKRGLGAEQVATLFVHTLPIMVSWTLPIASLFAATIVYGRFSQDNELMASRASGVASFTLLKPALVLGVLVTGVSLWLSNFVSPMLMERIDVLVKSNARGIAYRQLSMQGYIRTSDLLVHADRVDERHDTLLGAVVAVKKGAVGAWGSSPGEADNVKFVTASSLQVKFDVIDGDTYASAVFEDPYVSESTSFDVGASEQPLPPYLPLERLLKEQPTWYTWQRLLETRENPSRNADIRKSLQDVRRLIGYERLAWRIADTINRGVPFTALGDPLRPCWISAPSARRSGVMALLMGDPNGPAGRRRVVVKVGDANEPMTIKADSASVKAAWSPLKGQSVVSIVLDGNVWVRVDKPVGAIQRDTSRPAAGRPAATMPSWTLKKRQTVGDLHLPVDLARGIEEIDFDDMLRDAQNKVERDGNVFTKCAADAGGERYDLVPAEPNDIVYTPGVLGQINGIKEWQIRRLLGKILAEMNGRVAYCASCFLMVALGAALGMMFRGGQIISAFVLCLIPAMVVVVMVIMGKQMLADPNVSPLAGLGCIWGSVAALLLGNAGIYGHLMRR